MKDFAIEDMSIIIKCSGEDGTLPRESLYSIYSADMPRSKIRVYCNELEKIDLIEGQDI